MNQRTEVLQENETDQSLELERVALENGDQGHRRANDEALRLVHQVFLPNSDQAPGVVVFAGINHGNGCTKVSASVAEVLATDGRRSVCLVEANFRSPVASALYVAKNGRGLTDALLRKGPIRSFCRPMDVTGNLWSLSCGAITSDSPTLLTSSSLRERMDELRAEFDFVIIDAPPLTRYADAIALGQLADGLVLIVESGRTRRDETAETVASLRACRVAILAAVLNKDTSLVPEKIYKRL
jgi:capsular exopolysaccharide synthesis family protein